MLFGTLHKTASWVSFVFSCTQCTKKPVCSRVPPAGNGFNETTGRWPDDNPVTYLLLIARVQYYLGGGDGTTFIHPLGHPLTYG